MKSLKHICFLIGAFLMLSLTVAEEIKKWPHNGCFKGIEDRIVQADAIVIGRAQIVQKQTVKEPSEYQIRAIIQVDSVLIGDPSLKQIEYVTKYFPGGISTFGKGSYFSASDEASCLLIQSAFPYTIKQPQRIIAFAKKENNKWKIFYALFETKSKEIERALSKLIELEKVQDGPSRNDQLLQIAQKNNPSLLKEYAIRSLLKSKQSYEKKNEMVIAALSTNTNNEDLSKYIFTCAVAHLQFGLVPSESISVWLDTLISLVEKSQSLTVLTYDVSHLKQISKYFLNSPKKSDILQKSIENRGVELKKDGKSCEIFDQAKKELFNAIQDK